MPDEADEVVDLVVRGPADVMAFLRACEVRGDEPAQILLGLAITERDPLAHVICGAAVRTGGTARGEAAGAVVDVEQLVDLADELLVGAVVLATVEPGPGRGPDRVALRRFVALRRGCADAGVVLLDWIVVTGAHWWSMREQVIQEAA